MTIQISEKLLYMGKIHGMREAPLAMYFELEMVEPAFEIQVSSLWRGYVGTWEIVDDRLYMVELTGKLEDGSDANLATIFPSHPDKVFAHWYSGKISIHQGQRIKYVPGYSSVYEKDLFFIIDKGVVTNVEVILNCKLPDLNVPDVYDVTEISELPPKNNEDTGDKR
jgi:hypothetical protein